MHRRLSFLTLICSDVGCRTVAKMIKGKTPEEIRKFFNIVNPEEEVRHGGSTRPSNFSLIYSLLSSRPRLRRKT